jgi:transcriptional regulator of arginine metabolism
MAHKSRLETLAKIIRENQIASQLELTALLNEYGFKVTQPNVCRDLKKLGVIKKNGCYHLPGIIDGESQKVGRCDILSAGSGLIVVKTDPGAAAHLGILIDEQRINGVLGTIAGDDTIFCVIAEGGSHASITEAIYELCR